VTARHTLSTRQLSAGYGDTSILNGIDITIPTGQITSIIGANACGKSTLLRTMSRLLTPHQGQVLLDGRSIHKMATKDLAQLLGLLPQSPIAPEGITVGDLVSRGRHPYHKLFSQWSSTDDVAIASALKATNTAELIDRDVDELSGGQRQRVWIAMALAQETDILLLDEPTTYLDVAHQIEILDLMVELNQDRGTTIILVLHDLNLAARYSDHLIAMKSGRVFDQGSPQHVMTEPTVHSVFGLNNKVISDPISKTPMVLPIGRYKQA